MSGSKPYVGRSAWGMMFGPSTAACGHAGRAPWGVIKCARPARHSGQHMAKGLRWGAEGKVKLGGASGRKGGKR